MADIRIFKIEGTMMKDNPSFNLYNAIDTIINSVGKRTECKQIIVDIENMDCIHLSRNLKNGYLNAVEPHKHEHTELCICIDGSFALQFGEKMADVNEGDFSIIFSDVLHGELIRQGYSYSAIWIAIDDIRTTLHISGRNGVNEFIITDWYRMKSDYEYLQILKNINAELLSKSLHHAELINSHLLHLLILILRKIKHLNVNSSEKISWKESIVAEINEYIEKNYNKHVKLEDIAQKLCLSVTYLNIVFKSVSGKSIMQYYNDFRIEKAKKLLASSEYSVEDIATLLGYYDQYHFCKTFKNKTGYTPTKYKKLAPESV